MSFVVAYVNIHQSDKESASLKIRVPQSAVCVPSRPVNRCLGWGRVGVPWGVPAVTHIFKPPVFCPLPALPPVVTVPSTMAQTASTCFLSSSGDSGLQTWGLSSFPGGLLLPRGEGRGFLDTQPLWVPSHLLTFVPLSCQGTFMPHPEIRKSLGLSE